MNILLKKSPLSIITQYFLAYLTAFDLANNEATSAAKSFTIICDQRGLVKPVFSTLKHKTLL